MKALQKIAIVAFAVLSAGAAQAQRPACVDCAPPARPKAPSPKDPSCGTCGVAANKDITVAGEAGRTILSTDNFSNIFQNGDRQYACVDQAGPGNSATIVQDSKGDKSDFGNNAWAFQINNGVGGAGRNVSYAEQLGDRSITVQKQTGTGNLARARQGDEDYNVSYQDQTGYSNIAYSDQDGAFSQYSLQVQKGNKSFADGNHNYSAVAQTSLRAYSSTVQEGEHNTAMVYQH